MNKYLLKLKSTSLPFHLLKIRWLVALIISFTVCSMSHGQFVKTDGQKILDKDGNEIILRGIGLGGWMLQEGYMLRTGGAQHEIEAKITELIGQEKKSEFYEAWLANHFRKIDMDSMAAWGYNSVRLPMHYKLYTPPIEEEPVAGEITFLEKGFEMTDALLDWAEENNMYLILDLHAAPGGQGENADISDYDPSKPSLWESEANQDKMVALWRKLAERYVDEPYLAAYDIINEPNWGFQNHSSDLNGCAESQNTLLWDLQRRVTEAIREVDQNHMVIIEGNCWGNNYNGLPNLWDDNLTISYHKYWNSNAQSSIQGMLNMRSDRNVPIWLGETGENSNSWFTDAIELLETNNIGWSWWPLKKLGGNNPLQIEVNDGYQNILDYWSGNASKPSEDDAYDALMVLAEGLKLENNTYHPDVVDAMIRQPHSDETLPFKSNAIAAEGTSTIYGVNYDLGRHGFAYQDQEYTNETGQAGGQAWNLGYNYRNDGVDIEPCQDELSNGYNVGWTNDGEWLQYTLNVASAGAYDVDIRYAAQNSGSAMSIWVDGSDQSGPVALAATGGYQNWATETIEDVVMYEGTQKVRVFVNKGGFNFNYLQFTLKKNLNEISFSATSGATSETGKTIYLSVNKSLEVSTVSNAGFELTVDGTTANISSASGATGNDRQIILKTDATIVDISQVRLSYNGTQIQSADGTALEAFSNLEITNNLPAHTVLPAMIQAEDFFFNQGLELENTTDTGGGQNVGYTNSGDYLDYNIRVSEESAFIIEARIACNSNAGVLEFQQLDADDEILNNQRLDVPVTGGWQEWETVSTVMNFSAGSGKLRVKIVQPEFNINWFRFTPTVINEIESDAKGYLEIYPNPAKTEINLAVSKKHLASSSTLKITTLGGQVVTFRPKITYEQMRGIPTNHMSAGLYLLELSSGDNTWKSRLIIN